MFFAQHVFVKGSYVRSGLSADTPTLTCLVLHQNCCTSSKNENSALTLILWWRTCKARLLDKLDSATLNFVTPSLKEGKAPVLECGHVVILGWSPIVPALVSELCFARKEVGGTVLPRNLLLFHETCCATSKVLVPGDFVGQLIVQSSKQRGLSGFIAQIFGFDGDEFYIQPVQRTEGLTFGQVLRGLPGVGAVGIRKPGKGTRFGARDGLGDGGG